jgi:putative membrane-bound dehydrogenase-like protein
VFSFELEGDVGMILEKVCGFRLQAEGSERRWNFPLKATRRARWLVAATLCSTTAATGVQLDQNRPLSPDEALGSFALEPGYRIELVAAEPLIKSPVAMAFDERGRLYVVENRGYPDPLEGSGPPTSLGVIALLEDANRDGRFDKRTDFATGLTYPNGVTPWDGGIFVTCAPDLLYFKDTNGDGVADIRRVVLSGFATTRTAQIRFSHPTLALDNWIYLTGGLNGGRVRAPDQPTRPAVEFTNSDSRFNPFTLAFELTGGQGQFGLTFDDHGRRFICDNRHPVWHVVLEPRYLKRNPHLAFSATVQEVSKSGADATVWPLTADMTTASFIPSLMSAPHAGTFTAASGVHIHRGDALPAGHESSLFICESAQNLVQRQIRSSDGVTFTSRPARAGADFLASRDSWFRPVFAANGPDGALYIVDMYRRFIDHPQYVPEGSRALLDFESGKERGRIYRIVAQDRKREIAPIDLRQMSPAELSATLEHRNAWQRETAQRLIVERRDRAAVPALRRLATTARSDVARIHALWTLDGLGALEAADVAKALEDQYAAVRENAVRLAETRVAASTDLLTQVVRLTDDGDTRVRFQVALTLGEADDARVVPALAAIARRDGAQSWIRAAILSSIRGRTPEFLRSFLASPSPTAVKAAMMQDLGQLFGAGESPERCLDLILEIAEPVGEVSWQIAALSGLAQGLRTRGLGSETRSAFMALLAEGSPKSTLANNRVSSLLMRVSAAALDDKTPTDVRLAAITLLGHTDHAIAGKALNTLLDPRQGLELQAAAARALAQLPGRQGAIDLTQRNRWTALTPQTREAVLSALMSEERHTEHLLDAVESGAIAATTVGPSRRNRLTTHRNAAIQTRARALFAVIGSADRMQVYERLRATVLTRTGNAASGKPIFDSRCAACHAFSNAGGRPGPDLSGLRNQPADAILLHTIVPEYEIAPGYDSYIVDTRDGRTIFGRLESEAPNSLTLREASSQPHVILRTDVVRMSAAKSSLMPNELERGLSDQELADLIAYLKSSMR